MTTTEFAKLVKRMREAQKKYFATRSREVLEESKKLERLVDMVTDELLDNQTKLL